MTARLPIPGSDSGTWGDILNSFLEVSLNADGTIQTAALGQAGGELVSNKGQPGGYASLASSGLVPTTQLGAGTASGSNFLRGDGTWVVPNSGSSTLAADTDVTITSPTNGQVLTYNTGASKWENVAPAVVSVDGMTGAVTGLLQAANNLSEVTNDATARANLGLGTASTESISAFAQTANNLSDLASVSSARTNLGLGTAATENIDTTAGDIAALGSQAAGNVGKVADAGHVHPMPTLNQINAPTANVSLNSNKITNLANGTASTDAAAFGQIPTGLPPTGSAGGDLTGTYPNPTLTGTTNVENIITANTTVAGALQKANNLSDLASASTARTNLGLGNAATENIGTTSGTVAAGNDTRITGAIQSSSFTAKGDLLAGTGSSTFTNFTAGGNGQIAMYDSTQTAGLRAVDLSVIETFSMTNTLSVKTGASRQYFEAAYTITNVRASVGTAPTGSSIIIDVLKNGTTIYTTQGNRPTIAINGNTATANNPDITSIAAGDYLTINVAQIGSGTAGADLTVSITVRHA